MKTALGAVFKPNLMLRAAKILVCISVAAGHSHRRHGSRNPYSLQKLLCQAKLKTTEKKKPVHKTSTLFYVHCPVQTIQEVPGEGHST